MQISLFSQLLELPKSLFTGYFVKQKKKKANIHERNKDDHYAFESPKVWPP